LGVVLLSLKEFIEFVAGITGVDQLTVLDSIRELVLNSGSQNAVKTLSKDFVLVYQPENREIKLVGNGIIYAVYRR